MSLSLTPNGIEGIYYDAGTVDTLASISVPVGTWIHFQRSTEGTSIRLPYDGSFCYAVGCSSYYGGSGTLSPHNLMNSNFTNPVAGGYMLGGPTTYKDEDGDENTLLNPNMYGYVIRVL